MNNYQQKYKLKHEIFRLEEELRYLQHYQRFPGGRSGSMTAIFSQRMEPSYTEENMTRQEEARLQQELLKARNNLREFVFTLIYPGRKDPVTTETVEFSRVPGIHEKTYKFGSQMY